MGTHVGQRRVNPNREKTKAQLRSSCIDIFLQNRAPTIFLLRRTNTCFLSAKIDGGPFSISFPVKFPLKAQKPFHLLDVALSVRPNVGIKSRQIVFKSGQKVGRRSFKFKSNAFQKSPKIC